MPAITLNTNPTQDLTPFSVSKMVDLVFSREGISKYPREVVQKIGNAVLKWSLVYRISPRVVMAQILHETGFFRFGGDVYWWQFNLAGLGAEGGIVGHMLTIWITKPTELATFNWRNKPAMFKNLVFPISFIDIDASVDRAVCAVVQHHCVYNYGARLKWPNATLAVVDPRYVDVLDAKKSGTIHSVAGYSKNWAVGADYGQALVDTAALLVEIGASTVLKLAFSAGHHNTSGGDSEEYALTGPLTKRYIEIGKQLGHDVRSLTPDNGLGKFNGSLSECAQQVVNWNSQGWTADLFLEVHFEGLSYGQDIGRGVFVIYPDWNDDVDTDVRDTLGPKIAQNISNLTGLPLRSGTGLMSEKATGVGIEGFRLGIFGTTEPLRKTTTRMIVEHGCHTAPTDKKLISTSSFNDNCVKAFYRAIHVFYGLPEPAFDTTTPAPVPGPVTPPPSGTPIYGQAFQNNGFWVIEEIAWKIEQLGSHWFSVLGPPISGMFVAEIGKQGQEVPRKVQLFEKGALAIYNPGTPDGSPYGDPFHVRNLFPQEREQVIAQLPKG